MAFPATESARGRQRPWCAPWRWHWSVSPRSGANARRSIDGAIFLGYRDGTFHDVSVDVCSGAQPVRFFDARPDQK
jgi:hypothetical protein